MIKYSYKTLNDNVTKFCGEAPVNFQQIDIQSNPNYVFKNDPSFISIQLFDVEGNSVFVNSYLECQHYVSGGWDYVQFQRHESDYHIFLIYFSFIAVMFTYIFTKNTLKKIFK